MFATVGFERIYLSDKLSSTSKDINIQLHEDLEIEQQKENRNEENKDCLHNGTEFKR